MLHSFTAAAWFGTAIKHPMPCFAALPVDVQRSFRLIAEERCRSDSYRMNTTDENSGGEGGIRTPDTLSGMPVFKTGAINHSATSPVATAAFGFGTAGAASDCFHNSKRPQSARRDS